MQIMAKAFQYTLLDLIINLGRANGWILGSEYGVRSTKDGLRSWSRYLRVTGNGGRATSEERRVTLITLLR